MLRFGRDYLSVELYTEMTFPQTGVRFVAIYVSTLLGASPTATNGLGRIQTIGSSIRKPQSYEYAGHSVSCRRGKVSYKTNKSVPVPESDWIITRDLP